MVLGFVLIRLVPRVRSPRLGGRARPAAAPASSGNLIDRLVPRPGFLRGHVVDFSRSCRTGPVFNVADMCITVRRGAIMLLVAVGTSGFDGARHGQAAATARTRPDVAEHKVCSSRTGLEGERVDAGLARMLGLSRTTVADLIATGRVLLDGAAVGQVGPGAGRERCSRSSCRGPTGPSVVAARSRACAIVYDDDDIVVVDKPVGVAAHPSLGWTGPDVLGHLAGPGFRISTSGVAGAARHRAPARRRHLRADGGRQERARRTPCSSRRSSDRTVDKTYHALVQGHPDPFRGTIDAPIGRHPASDWKFAVVAGGRHSVTHYDTLEAFVGATCSRCTLETGRTHQIRVHLAATGTRASATRPTAPTRCWPPGSG